MDDIVKQALVKWPNVPDCYGWLGLDARGNWYMRDAAVQALGAFPQLNIPADPATRGSRLVHDKLIAFIARNYESDTQGCWFFQNGPQRVYVELEATPWIWRVQRNATGEFSVSSHTGVVTTVQQCWLDECGHVYLSTTLGFGLVHSQDVPEVAQALEAGLWPLTEVKAASLTTDFDYVQSPAAIHSNRSL